MWNLLDVIHRRANRREESDTFEELHNKSGKSTFQVQLAFMSNDDVQQVRKERDNLLDKVAEMETENLSGRIKESQLQEKLHELQLTKADLEEQLSSALNHKLELNSRIHDLQIVNRTGE